MEQRCCSDNDDDDLPEPNKQRATLMRLQWPTRFLYIPFESSIRLFALRVYLCSKLESAIS